jgi:hypothetical protein
MIVLILYPQHKFWIYYYEGHDAKKSIMNAKDDKLILCFFFSIDKKHNLYAPIPIGNTTMLPTNVVFKVHLFKC